MSTSNYQLEKKTSCFNDLRWHFSLINTDNTVDQLISKLAKSKHWNESIDMLYPKLITYIRNNHRVIIIPSTGRIEIRIHYTTPILRRSEQAQKLASLLAALIQSPDSHSDTLHP